MSVGGDEGEGEGEEPSSMVEGEEDDSSSSRRGPGERGEGPWKEIGEEVEGEMAREEGREEDDGTTNTSVSIWVGIQRTHYFSFDKL